MFTQGWCVISSLFLWHSWPSWLGTWLWNALKETQTSERCQSASWLGFGNRMNREYALFSVMKCDQEQPPNWRLPIHTYMYTHTQARTISGIIFCCWIHFLQGLFFTFGNISLFDPYTEDRGTTTGPLPAMSPVIAVRTLMSLCNVS